ncbi:MAG TPA: DUF4173 domain-containing protein [Gemmatimonadaceae bacterium]
MLSLALLGGIAGDVLLDLGGPGVGFVLWVGVIVATFVALAWRAELAIPREGAAWLAVAIVCTLGAAWRNSEQLQFFNVVGALGALIAAAATINRAGSVLFAPRLRDSALALVLVCRDAAFGLLPLAFRELPLATHGTNARTRLWRFLRVGLVVVPLLVIFGSLLRSADPIFASFVALPSWNFEHLGQHVFLIAFFTVAIAGLTRAALIEKSDETTGPALHFQIAGLEVTAALVTLNVLFAAYLVAQLGWFFGGEAFLQARTGLTAAQYARSGFFQMVWVVILVVPILIGTRVFLAPGRALAHRHMLLSLPIVGLLGAMILSAALRMRLYVHYYGLSTDRFYPLVFMAWLGIVLLWLSVTVLRGWGRPFVAGATISALGVLMGLNVAAPDRIVARVNLDRAARADASMEPLDIAYLSRLGGEATDLVVPAVIAAPSPPPTAVFKSRWENPKCAAAENLLRRWGPESRARATQDRVAAWRAWNAGEAAGLRAVGPHSGELRAIAHAECQRAKPAPAQR